MSDIDEDGLETYEAEFIYEQVDKFTEDFAKLVRKHVRECDERLSKDYDKALLLACLQERTSVFNPYVWSKRFD